jgi:hypothetical protein
MPRHDDHDANKHKHGNKASALREVKRLRQENRGRNGTERLGIYYSQARGGWLVGKTTKKEYSQLHNPNGWWW